MLHEILHCTALFACSEKISEEMMIEAKQFGMSDKQIGRLVSASENDARIARINQGIRPWVKQVIRC